jgi:predicted flap endonuclease-1-like 5' DNA nuclease
MTILLVQTFLLMLAAFLLGASLACLIRRGLSGDQAAAAATSASSLAGAAAAPAAGVDRFGRALTGDQVPPVFLPGQPVVEVQPKPRPAPEPVAKAAPQVAPQPAPHHEPPPSPPQRDVIPPTPVAAPEPSSAPAVTAPPPASAPEASHGESYTQIAVAAAAGALAASKAREEAEAQEAARAEAEATEAARVAAEAEAAEAAARAEAEALEAERVAAEEAARFEAEAAEAARQQAELSAVPEAAQEDVFEPAADEAIDDLTRIFGIDADLKARLVRYGVFRFSQIAAWTPDDVNGVNQTLGFQGRVERENWVEQARILAAGGDPGGAAGAEPSAPVQTIAPVDGERLHRIIGVDPDSEALLRANGVTTLVQIAGWSAEDVAHFETLLGAPGRITRESWVEQALFLTGLAAPLEEPEPVADEEPAPEAVPGEASAESGSRGDSYVALRSVRSEALRGEGVGFSTDLVQDLKRIRGIGVLIEKKLNSLGITAYEQVANWTRSDIDRVSELLDFKGRIERENWIEQARILASGGQTEFSRRVDRGDA